MAVSTSSTGATGPTICAPAAGWVVPLDQVPDPAFASAALGAGLAIELLDETIRSPCDGVVAAVATARHAVTIEVADGRQILIHCGIDTVALGGSPFAMLVSKGDTVTAGDPLMQVDLAAVARAGKSLATPIIVLDSEARDIQPHGAFPRPCEAGETLFQIAASLEAADRAGPQAAMSEERSVTLPLPHGLHARPAAAIAAEAARWDGPIEIVLGAKTADGRSTTSVMKLGASHGARLTVRAGGKDAAQAVDAVVALIESGAGDVIEGATKPASEPASPKLRMAPQRTGAELPRGTIAGVAAAPGQALAKAFYLHRSKLEVTETSQGADVEHQRFADAQAELRASLDAESKGHGATIAAAHLAILDDPVLLDTARTRIEGGASAAMAWQDVMTEQEAEMRALEDSRLADRADDFADLRQRFLRVLVGAADEVMAPAGSIVIANDLYPSDFEALMAAGIAGIATMAGGPTSHLAILAASAGIPMAVAFGKPLCEVPDDCAVHLDGSTGLLRYTLSEAEQRELAHAIERRTAAHETALCQTMTDTRLASGERIEVFANLGSVADASEAVRLGAEGIGLLRTEFLFLHREAPPSEEEQAQIYGEIMDAFDDRPVIIRTLDIGADKPADYLALEPEDNPALGLRGIRVSLRFPDLLESQLRAILRAAGSRPAHIMAPMIASAEEFDTLRTIVDHVREDMGHTGQVRLGAMIETPASALLADALARRVDFLSVGTNDLTQYALAVDRTNPALAAMLDPLHPAVLRLIAMTGEACSANGVQLGVCGGAAGDHLAAVVLIGLGVTELSASAARIPELKQHLRGMTLDQCRAAAKAALACESPQEVRTTVGRLLDLEEVQP
ncbi:phosphoenolpyruvate--protein phosphotransferase [Alteriqipengyuania lutimaris]|uniref:phosphoenolpyruvate--protein phosphotransferase n=1 Tax=Alteriqipengyuania lutimaris TaxID=1538146 RepID=A0A395LI44_9SPHN|nr:phosphoenolpyruvate--protein phosphotransferase [Alteriqipengyuania lutimaris]MBB3034858.1 phosphoenolpyruvate-protein phosphotransferase [Alteriqipengyuania lutimaris]RDS76309.1 phosphoenolpyruvate--protein phosphotransferase [Alteriqipengyuania lutimaris]